MILGYLYRHIRLDKNQPFYIGIGRYPKSKDCSKFYRAFKKTRANRIWNNIVAKTDYEVEILLENLTLDELREKEIEFIKLYGRIDIDTGTLANLTDGGEGTLNCKGNLGKKHSNETKNKISNSKKGYTTDYNRLCMKKVNQYDLKGNFIKEWPSVCSVDKFGFQNQNVMKCCKGRRNKHGGFIWKFVEKEIKN